MSAFLCNSHHIAALAAFAVNNSCVVHQWRMPGQLQGARVLAGKLAEANGKSLEARYGDEPVDIGFIDECAEQAEKYLFNPPRLGPVEIIKMAKCFDYQACEIKGYELTNAARQVQYIIDTALRKLPGYESAPWEWHPDMSRDAA